MNWLRSYCNCMESDCGWSIRYQYTIGESFILRRKCGDRSKSNKQIDYRMIYTKWWNTYL